MWHDFGTVEKQVYFDKVTCECGMAFTGRKGLHGAGILEDPCRHLYKPWISKRGATPINPEQEALRGTRLRKLALADGAQSMIPRFINRRKREADINSFWIFHCHLPKRIFDDDGDIIFIARRKLVSCEFLITATADWIAPIGCTACSFTILLWYTWYFLLFYSALTDYFLPIFSGF